MHEGFLPLYNGDPREFVSLLENYVRDTLPKFVSVSGALQNFRLSLKVTEWVYLCTISKDSHRPSSFIVIVSTPAFLNRQAKVRLNACGLQGSPVTCLSLRSMDDILHVFIPDILPSALYSLSHARR